MHPAGWGTQDWLAAGCGEIVRVWHPQDPKQEVKVYEGTSVYSVDFSSNNNVLAVAGDKGQIALYSSKTHDSHCRAVGHFPNPPEVGVESFTCVKFAANGLHLIAGCHNGTVYNWALRGGNAVQQISLRNIPTSVAVSDDAELIAVTSSTGQVQVHDFKTSAKVKTLAPGPGPATSHACFSSQAPLFAVGDAAGTAFLWGSDSFERLRELTLHKAGVTGLALSMTTADLLFSCGNDGVMKCWDLRMRKEAWSVLGRQPYTALSLKHDSQMVAVGNTTGCVSIHDVRNFRVPCSMQQFSNNSAAVSVVRWQHLHVSRGSRAPSSTVSAATTSVSAAAAAQGSDPAATARRQHQQQQQPGLQSQRPSVALPAATEIANAQSVRLDSAYLRSTGPGTVKGNATGVLDPDTPSTSVSASVEFGMRSFSPVHMGGDDTATSATSWEAASSAAAATLTTLTTPEAAATPENSLCSTGPGGAFMLTPGIGIGYAADGSTPSVSAAALDATPISGWTGGPASVALRPLMAAAGQAPPSSTVPGANNSNSSSVITGSKQTKAPVMSDQPPPPGRAAVPPFAAAATSTAAVEAEAPAPAAASGGGLPANTRATSQRNSSSISGSTAAAMSRPSSRPVSASGAATAASDGPGNRKLSGRGLLESAEVAQKTAGGRSGGGGPGNAAGGAKAAGGPASRPSSAGWSGAVAPAAPADAVSGLREDVFKEYIDKQMAEMQDDIRNMHLDMLRQFHQAQMDLVSVVDGLAQRQDQLADAVGELTAVLQGMRAAKQLPVAGAVGLMPWI